MKLTAMGLSSLLGIGLAGLLGGSQPPDGPPPPEPKAKAKRKGEPGDELRKTYDILRRVRSGSEGGRTEERIKDWTVRATDLYRKALRAHEQGERRQARELAVASHDLARAADHARNAAQLDRTDPDLPPPPEDDGPEDLAERTHRDLRRAYERIREADSYGSVVDSAFYLRGARDLYNAARRDVEAGRIERGGELARAAEAMTHVPEHLAHAGDPDGPPAKDEPPKRKEADARKKAGPGGLFDPPDPKAERPAAPGRELPPPLD